MVGYPQTNRKIDTGKTLTRWPVFVDHFNALTQYIQDELRSTWHEGWLCASIAAFKAGFHDFSGMNFCTVDTANE